VSTGLSLVHLRLPRHADRDRFTYDILPASDSGTYFAGGVLIGSTLGGDALSSRGADYAVISLPSDP
jgi:hypothetical protein